MGLYCIGDVQGCDSALQRLLNEIDFSPSRDTIYLLGDLVNRGPESAAVLRRLMAYGDAAQCLLGNHDLSLLAVAHGARAPRRDDTMGQILQAADRDALLDWLRHRPLAIQAHGLLMVHAGVLPQWDTAQTLALVAEVQTMLRGPALADFLPSMYGDEPNFWDNALQGAARLRVIINALTRLRFCTPEGRMDLKTAAGPQGAPPGYSPWFDVPGRRTQDITMVFGHWSQLGWLRKPGVISLDTGCVWGGCLSALKLGSSDTFHELIQVKCEQSQAPGE